MSGKKRGFLSWLLWQLCDWRGQSSRRDFFWATVWGVLVYAVYTLLVYQAYVHFVPEYNGQTLTVKFLIDNRKLNIVPQWTSLPMYLMFLAISVKRLRDIGFSTFIGVGAVVVDLALPHLFSLLSTQSKALRTLGGAIATGWGWMLMLYFFTLLLTGTRAAGSRRSRAQVWAAIGAGGPHNMSGRIRAWRVK